MPSGPLIRVCGWRQLCRAAYFWSRKLTHDPLEKSSPRKLVLLGFLDRVWSCGDVDAVDEYVCDPYTIHNDPGDPWDRQTLSHAEFKYRLIKSRAVAPDQTFLPQEMIEEGDRIAVSWNWTGTHQGALPGIPASGRPIKMAGVTIYSFCGDMLSGHWQIADRLGIYRQLRTS